MSNFGDILRRAREENGRTLEDIAAATNINKRFLEDIEKGSLPKLPDTYIRAFIRAYAHEVGLNPDNLVSSLSPPSSTENPFFPLQPAIPNLTHEYTARQSRSSQVKGNPILLLMFVAGCAVIALVLIIGWMRSERNQKQVQEVSFSDVIREREASEKKEVQPILIPESSQNPGKDSLVLEGFASESEWMRIVRDSLKGKDYTLSPGSRTVWKAKHYFILSLGNAKAISFKLNGHNIGLPSVSFGSLSNIKFSWNTLDTLSAKSGQKEKGSLTFQKDRTGKVDLKSNLNPIIPPKKP
ncbi:MAG: helix-turn-helix domain-containing protein [Bacteroidota bacterium]